MFERRIKFTREGISGIGDNAGGALIEEVKRCYTEIERQREQLAIAIEALKKLANTTLKTTWQEDIQTATEALKAMGVEDV